MTTHDSGVQSLTAQLMDQSPIVRWGLAAAAALVLYLLWSSMIAPASRAWGNAADAIQRQAVAVRERDRMAAEIKRMEDTIVTIGPVVPPPYIEDGGTRLVAAVNETLKGVPHSLNYRSRGQLPRGSLQGLTVMGNPTRLTGDLRFEASPDDAIAIIAALESRPEITLINQAFITRIGNRRVSVQLTIESWVVTSEARSGRT